MDRFIYIFINLKSLATFGCLTKKKKHNEIQIPNRTYTHRKFPDCLVGLFPSADFSFFFPGLHACRCLYLARSSYDTENIQ